ncbi:MAG: hypothetical protein EXR72_16290 [Myxococcales bacterium]|nr:hypothetical protein [Myxococcales bacterium]
MYTLWRYLRTLVAPFRWTFVALALALCVGTTLYLVTPHHDLAGHAPPPHLALYGAWMALFAQPIFSPPETWYLALMCALYPLLGFILLGEGIVRLSLLLLSREHGEKEWMKVMAKAHRNHVVLCGLGHLGARILDQLLLTGAQVVVLERDPLASSLAQAKGTGVPVLIRDMKDDQALIDAGVEHARCLIIATNDDMANLEVALDARRLNPKIKVLMRMFDQRIADKIKDAFTIDQAFSSAALAAPLVAAMAQGGRVLATYPIGGVVYTTTELRVETASALAGRTIAEVEATYSV